MEGLKGEKEGEEGGRRFWMVRRGDE